jgi:AcrR family transcriptional regulator
VPVGEGGQGTHSVVQRVLSTDRRGQRRHRSHPAERAVDVEDQFARNRAALLTAAEAEFAEHGPEATVADIARRAGIGKGTVFRHFPTKEDLLAAVVLDRVTTLTALARHLAGRPDAGPALDARPLAPLSRHHPWAESCRRP